MEDMAPRYLDNFNYHGSW